jgi:hypothetical protein
MRSAPTYADAVQRLVVGDDPLGLAPTNERLYHSVFPGFNNYVRHIRVYSAICWMTKQVALALEKGAAQTDKDARALFDAAIEKMELVLLWANQGVQGLAGAQRVFPVNDQPKELSFSAFGTSRVSLFEAATYKPSLTSGLRFLEARDAGTYGCLPAGEALAAAFDSAVNELPGYRWLKATDRTTGRRSQAMELAPGLLVSEPPSVEEQTAFLANFFPDELREEPTNDERARWLALKLTLRSVAAVCEANEANGEPATAAPSEIRACMARGLATNGVSVVTAEDEVIQAWWAVLQVRQLQRFSLETLYCVVERWIQLRETDGKPHGVDDCLNDLCSAWQGHISEGLFDTVSQLEDFFRSLQGECSSLYEAAAHWRPDDKDDTNEADMLEHMSRMDDKGTLKILDDGTCDAVANAYIGLVFCAVETANLASNQHALKAMKADGDECSMLKLGDLVTRFRGESLDAFVRHVIREWVLLRHFAVAGSRAVASDGKNRFRFVVGDYGLERFDKTAPLPLPGMSIDKLNHALLLCAQAGLLAEKDGAYKLTAKGRKRLRPSTA